MDGWMTENIWMLVVLKDEVIMIRRPVCAGETRKKEVAQKNVRSERYCYSTTRKADVK